MARLVVHLTAETELIHDALDSLQRLHAALARRHGDSFRRLERDLDATLTSLQPAEIGHQHLAAATFVLTPPAAWLDLIARGHRLGVL